MQGEAKGINRRDFVKGAAALSAVAAAGIVGCASKAAPAKEPEVETSQTARAGKGLHDGKYVAKTMGHESWISVGVEIADKKIKSCRVLYSSETIGIGSYACERVPVAIVKAQSTRVDDVAGATMASKAIKKAVRQAITDAGGSDADFSAPIVPAPITPTTKTVSADVVVVGFGNAGIIAATRLVEMGRKVIVFDKNSFPGGDFAFTYGAITGPTSQMLKKYSAGRYDATNLNLAKVVAGFGATGYNAANDRFNKTFPYSTAMYGGCGSVVDWFNSIGIGSCIVGAQYSGTNYVLAPGMYMGGPGFAAKALESRFKTLGGEVYYQTAVTSLTKDAAGNITGVTAQGADGVTWNVNAKATILASGGFAKNKDMLKQYYGEDFAKEFFNCGWWSTGEVMQMAIDAGAGIECMGRHLPAYPATYASKFEIAFIHYTSPGIIVGPTGDVICNPMTSNHAVMADIQMDKKNKETFYWIMDETSAELTRKSESSGFDTYKALFEKGEAVHYESIEACAKELNLPNLKKAIDTNNELALQGPAAKDAFGRGNLPFIDVHTGLYAIRLHPTLYLTTGGLISDANCRVIKADGKTIMPGLYGIGDVTGSAEEKDGKTYTAGMSQALGQGWVVADTVQAALKA